jgi:hypothetical protein
MGEVNSYGMFSFGWFGNFHTGKSTLAVHRNYYFTGHITTL